MALIATAAGHGGRDSGATGNGYLEKDLTLATTLKLNELLSAAGHKVITYRETDTDYGLTANERTNRVPRWANENNADYFIDVHYNAGGGTGTECYHSVKDTGEGSRISSAICAEIAALGYRNRGDKTKVESGNDYFGVLRNCNKKNCNLVECAFIDSSDDMAKLNIGLMADAICNGICSVLGSYAPPPDPAPSGDIQVGDRVRLSGKIYSTSDATGGKNPLYTEAVVTRIVDLSKGAPYLLDDGNLGWARGADLEKINEAPPVDPTDPCADKIDRINELTAALEVSKAEKQIIQNNLNEAEDQIKSLQLTINDLNVRISELSANQESDEDSSKNGFLGALIDAILSLFKKGK